MSRPRKMIPAVSHHKATGQTRVRIGGKDFYCGPWGTPAAEEKARKVIAEYLTTAKVPETTKVHSKPDIGISVAELFLAYNQHCDRHYRKNGQPTSERNLIRDSLRVFRELYGSADASLVTPMMLEAARNEMIRKGWVRRSINLRIGRIRRAFRWGVSKGLVRPEVLHGLAALDGLQWGRSEATESTPVEPVEETTINATLPHLTPQIRDMVRLQLLSGCRPGEICLQRFTK
ncbi:MAG: hypothetical protein WBC44_21800 [Planctomycetaceae bacterium]